MTDKIRIVVMGSGTSMGVPTLGCHCAVCESTDPHDKRLRPSLLLARAGQNVVIDTGPDFRTQALRAGLDRLDAVLLTHCHADHILGFDDLRPYNFRQKGPIPIYGSADTFGVIRRVFSYVFDSKPTLSSIPSVELREVDGPFVLLGVPFIPVPLLHGEMEVLGFRFGRAAYMTDFSRLPESSVPLLEGLDDLILDALRDVPHPMHQTVEQALALIDRLKPKRAWFTHIAHDLPHEATNERLRKAGYSHVQLAYDGLELQVSAESGVAERAGKTPTTPVQESDGSIAVFTSAADWAKRYGNRKPAGAAPPTEHASEGSVIAIGTFDGIHLGHQHVLKFAIERAKEIGAVATALTFEPPPVKVLRPEVAPPRISTNQQRLDWFGAVGMEAAVVLPFTKELAALTPEEFIKDILVRQLNVRAVVVGDNFRFGKQQAGDV
jgi:phosphoribosyl 1,2-cyclic phosphate phosphodiesterase